MVEALTLAEPVPSSPKASREEVPSPSRPDFVPRTLSDHEERELLESVQLLVRRVYMHVRDKVRETGDAQYLPTREASGPEYV